MYAFKPAPGWIFHGTAVMISGFRMYKHWLPYFWQLPAKT